MEKFLESDWLTAVHFLVNTVQKQGSKISQSMKNCDWLINNQCSPEARAAGGFAVYTLFQKEGYFY